jgi:hypothetical protein
LARTPAAAAPPTVESYDELAYTCKAGDSWAKVSDAFYKTDIYAVALERYNRDLSGGQRRDTLAAGEKIYIPPVGVLVRRHGAVIPKQDAAPSGGVPSGSVPTPPAAPVTPAAGSTIGSAPARITPVAASSVAAPGAASGTPARYVVRGSGESFRTIADLTLNNRERWGDLADLNRNINPEYQIPPGTVLTLPAGARVPPGNMP